MDLTLNIKTTLPRISADTLLNVRGLISIGMEMECFLADYEIALRKNDQAALNAAQQTLLTQVCIALDIAVEMRKKACK